MFNLYFANNKKFLVTPAVFIRMKPLVVYNVDSRGRHYYLSSLLTQDRLDVNSTFFNVVVDVQVILIYTHSVAVI